MKTSVNLFLGSVLALSLVACGGNTRDENANESAANPLTEKTETGNPSYDPERGEGKFKNVELPASLDQTLATTGENVYNVKCSACHKVTDEKLVGPGWKGVTSRHKPEWIMNFITNTDEMLNKDPKAQAQLEICLVRMPNQSLSDEDARSLLEFMRKNDGVK